MTTYVYRRSQTWLETKFHVANSRNKDLVYNGILTLPHYVCFIGKLGSKKTSYLYGLSQTWLETKFHVPKSRNQVSVNNGIMILPHYVSFIGKLS